MAIRYRPVNLRILSLRRRQLRRPWGSATPPPALTYRLLAENTNVVTTEAGIALRTEQN